MIGDACASPGIGERQRTFSPLSMFQWTGAAALESTPDAWGPRNCGQSLAGACRVDTSIRRKRAVRMVCKEPPIKLRGTELNSEGVTSASWCLKSLCPKAPGNFMTADNANERRY